MTAKRKHGNSVMRLERVPNVLVDYSRVHHVAGGPYAGILINKSGTDLENTEPPECRLEFLAFIKNDDHNTDLQRDLWLLRFWFQGGLDGLERKDTFVEYFHQLMDPTNFPNNYIGFVKRALVVLRKHTKIRRVELEVQQIEECHANKELPPIKSFVTVYTPSTFIYQFVPEVNIENKNFLTFKVKTGGNAHIALCATYGEVERDALEIVIGTDNNTKSLIREGSQGYVRAESITYNVLSSKNYRYFWLSWDRHRIEVGRGAQYGLANILQYDVPSYRRFDVSCFAVATNSTSKGVWEFAELIFDIPEHLSWPGGRRNEPRDERGTETFEMPLDDFEKLDILPGSAMFARDGMVEVRAKTPECDRENNNFDEMDYNWKRRSISSLDSRDLDITSVILRPDRRRKSDLSQRRTVSMSLDNRTFLQDPQVYIHDYRSLEKKDVTKDMRKPRRSRPTSTTRFDMSPTLFRYDSSKSIASSRSDQSPKTDRKSDKTPRKSKRKFQTNGSKSPKSDQSFESDNELSLYTNFGQHDPPTHTDRSLRQETTQGIMKYDRYKSKELPSRSATTHGIIRYEPPKTRDTSPRGPTTHETMKFDSRSFGNKSPRLSRFDTSASLSSEASSWSGSIPHSRLHDSTDFSPQRNNELTDSRKKLACQSLLWLGKREKILDVIEEVYPDSIDMATLLKYCRLKPSDKTAAEVMLKDLDRRSLIKQMDNDQWIRQPEGFTRVSHVIKMSHGGQVSGSDQPTIAVIVSLYCEMLAVEAMLENKKTYARHRTNGGSEMYTVGDVGPLKVVATKLSKSGQESHNDADATGSTVTRLLGTFCSVEHVLLVGVGGAVAHTSDYRQHARLGDIVVSLPADTSGARYVNVEKVNRVGNGFSYLTRVYGCMDATLLRAVDNIKRRSESKNHSSWEGYVEQGQKHLNGTRYNFQRPLASTDRSFYMTDNAGIFREHEHPAPVGPDVYTYNADCSRVHYGAVGCGKLVSRCELLRGEFSDLNSLRCYDADRGATTEELEDNCNDSFLVIRGMADYADGTVGKTWQPYAALVAAAFMKAVIMGIS